MASDSDVEAYLNQLSRKTHHLKQDSRPWEDSVSSPSGADEPSEVSASSGRSLKVASRQPNTYKAAAPGLISDITALSEKYSFTKDKKSPGKDRFSTLEEKYLKKYNVSASPKRHELSNERKQRKNLTEKSEERDSPGGKFDSHVTRKERKAFNYVNSSEEIEDENLAHYLSEVTLTSERQVGDQDSHGDNSDTDDSTDVLNLKNVIDVEELLAQEENSSRSVAHLSPVHQSVENDSSKGRNKSRPESKLVKSQSKEAKVTEDEQTKTATRTNILSPSKSSLFYSGHKGDEEEEAEEEEEEKQQTAVRLLLAQTDGDVFHSSRRKSSLSFDGINLGTINLLKSSQQTHKRKTRARHKSSSEGSIATPSESQISEQVLVSEQSEDDLTANNVPSEQTQEPTIVSEVKEDSHLSSSASIEKSEGSKQDSISSHTMHSVDVSSSKSHKKHTKASSSKDHKSGNSRSHKQSHTHHNKGRKGHRSSHRKHKDTGRTTRKTRKTHRSPSSSSFSSSSSSSSSEASYSTSEPVRRKSRSRKHSRRAAHRHWSEPPFLQHGVWPCCCTHAGYAAPHHTLPPFTGHSSTMFSGGGVGVEEVMQQQVSLVKQFLDSQQVMYQAYTSTLISSYRYTSLRRTEKYIKKKKPPLTFPEAYRLVKEEMDASQR